MNEKHQAYQFLKTLELKLNEVLPDADTMREQVPNIVSQAKKDDTRKHMRQPEDAFLHHFAFPVIFKHLSVYKNLGEEKAREALLSEYYRNMPEFCAATPARKSRHPFNKVIGASTDTIMRQWKGELSGAKLKQSCPDFALRNPFPHKIVFEGKYFAKGGSKKAETELVNNVYQAFFYRGLPRDRNNNGPDWDYDYSCLFAFDATEDAALWTAWNNLAPDVKTGFWEGANLYVMILRGQ